MQRLGHPRMLGRQWATSQHPIHQIIRHHVGGRNTWRGRDPTLGRADIPTYTVNRLLLDLDAEDAEHVRPYDPDIDGKPENRHAKRIRMGAQADGRIEIFFGYAKKRDRTFYNTCRSRAVEWYINDLVIISTLLGGRAQNHQSLDQESSDTTDGRSSQSVNNTLHGISDEGMEMNGIPRTANNFNLISYMLHRQKQTLDSHSTLHDFTKGMSRKVMHDMIWKSNSVMEIKRPLFFIANTVYGSELVSKQSRQLAETCSRVVGDCQDVSEMDKSTALEMLKLCNDLVLHLLKEKLPIDQQLWCLGFELAVRLSAFPAARMYLETGLRLGEQNLHGTNFLLRPLQALLRSMESSPSGHHAAIFGLLTGQDLSGHQSPFSVQSMIESIKPSDPAIYQTYIHILGELGALRTLWHLFHQLPRLLDTRNDGTSQIVPDLKEFNDQFVYAFLRSSRHVGNNRISVRDMRLAETTGNYIHDCELDLQTIFRSFRSESRAKRSESSEISTSSEMKKAISDTFRVTDIAFSMQVFLSLIRTAARAGTGIRTNEKTEP
ncbi:hypothetical protein PFICI_03747 [Pestalotiopsis fici W106-1]|uniref:Uncharacterized protein n=1 Tax=Pestalotiopsis fici (strain W106-1 / CGMCC3.15140) TaxID=1229662 RepID=W3XJU0_PESFW|nr:uncharacterized protein PFICI_03747 [Pestalotiopsis fici W106-1]ETS85722.1 hypothetical protein PFICI_03747 [Pestalotiopsis fici W106-1]